MLLGPQLIECCLVLRYLLPLYKPRGMLNYHPQLCYCIVQFVEKDPALAAVIINNLLRCVARNKLQQVIDINSCE